MPERDDREEDFYRREDNFAPPIFPSAPGPSGGGTPLPRLDPVTVTPGAQALRNVPRANLPTRPSVGTRLAQGLARVGGRILVFLTPMNSGPDGTGDLVPGAPQWRPPGEITQPEPLPELDPVYITPPPRGPTRISVAPDEINPPNWWEIATERPGETFRDWNRIIDTVARIGRRAYDAWDFLSGPDDRRAPQPSSSSGSLSTPSGPIVFPELEPVTITAPATRPLAPNVFPDPFAFPDPVRIGSPFFDPLPATRTRPVAVPSTRPAPRTPVNPTGPLSPFFQLPENYRPARPGPTRPNFLTDTTPGLFDELSPLPGMDPDFGDANPDQCECEKKPKKKKPPKEREVCKQGTYTQRKKGIKYAPKREVPCEEFESTKERKEAEKKRPPKLLRKPTKRKPKKRKPNPFESIYF